MPAFRAPWRAAREKPSSFCIPPGPAVTSLMRAAISLLLGIALAASIFFARRLYLHSLAADSADPSDIIKALALFILVAVCAGALFAMTLLPAAGEWIGNFFYSPVALMEKEPHAAALAKVAQGDYAGAVVAYARVVEENPDDALAIGEMAKLEASHLHRPDAAAARLEQAMAQEWSHDDAAFLGFRLADLYVEQLGHPAAAVALLQQIAIAMPQTYHAANATHRLREIEHAYSLGDEPKRRS